MIARHESSDDRLNLWAKLAAPLPDGVVKQRQGPGGRMLDYIDWPFIQERLDSVVPGEWDLVLEPIAIQQGGDDPFAVKARLTILGVIRENIGTGKDWKDAATDASKRAAVRFGIGLELYEKPAGNQTAAASRSNTSSQPSTSRPSAQTATDGADDPSCPKCGGRMWDNRLNKRNAKAPDFKCRTRSCDGVIWPPKANSRAAAGYDPDPQGPYDTDVPF